MNTYNRIRYTLYALMALTIMFAPRTAVAAGCSFQFSEGSGGMRQSIKTGSTLLVPGIEAVWVWATECPQGYTVAWFDDESWEVRYTRHAEESWVVTIDTFGPQYDGFRIEDGSSVYTIRQQTETPRREVAIGQLQGTQSTDVSPLKAFVVGVVMTLGLAYLILTAIRIRNYAKNWSQFEAETRRLNQQVQESMDEIGRQLERQSEALNALRRSRQEKGPTVTIGRGRHAVTFVVTSPLSGSNATAKLQSIARALGHDWHRIKEMATKVTIDGTDTHLLTCHHDIGSRSIVEIVLRD